MSRPFVLFLCLVTFLVTDADATPYQCQSPAEVFVTTKDEEMNAHVCAAAERAMVFLAEFAITPRRAIHLNISDAEIDGHGYAAFGSYDSRSDSIELMFFDAILERTENPQMYGESFDLEHYTGAIAHEIAHAVVQHNLKAEPISTGPQEYLAHATQLGVMPKDRRRAIIRAMNVSSWESGDAISDVYMAIEPGKFAVKSYLHLTSTENPLDFVALLLNAKWFYVYVP